MGLPPLRRPGRIAEQHGGDANHQVGVQPAPAGIHAPVDRVQRRLVGVAPGGPQPAYLAVQVAVGQAGPQLQGPQSLGQLTYRLHIVRTRRSHHPGLPC